MRRYIFIICGSLLSYPLLNVDLTDKQVNRKCVYEEGTIHYMDIIQSPVGRSCGFNF